MELLKPKKYQICKNEKNGRCFIDKYTATDELFMKEDAIRYAFTVLPFLKDDVEKELKLIKKHRGFAKSPIFIYQEDYSQYVPRGHYTRSEKLKNYFKAMMWYGRMSMLLKGTNQVKKGETCQDFPPCTALICKYDAKIQTLQALEIAQTFSKINGIKEKWNKIYEITSFYVGFSDDLNPNDYIEAINSVFGNKETVFSDEKLTKIKEYLSTLSKPKIYGGTGDVGIAPPFDEKKLDEILSVTQGFRFMGQRFVPDSYIFQNLVFPKVDKYLGKKKPVPFTFVNTDMGPTRGFPRGLDVMAVLGAKNALNILFETDDANYENYKKQFKSLQKEFAAFDKKDWQKNLYWNWLYCLKELINQSDENIPEFMNTNAWRDKTLTTALSSWTELRHDTILYAKQSYTGRKITSAGPHSKPKPVVGYVEPRANFYTKLKRLNLYTKNQLQKFDVLTDRSKYRLESFDGILNRLIELSEKELKNAIIYALTHNMKPIAQKAYRKVKREYNINKIVDAYIQIYKNLLGENQ